MSTSTIPSHLSAPPTASAVAGQTQTEDPTLHSGARGSASTDITRGKGDGGTHNRLGREIVEVVEEEEEEEGEEAIHPLELVLAHPMSLEAQTAQPLERHNQLRLRHPATAGGCQKSRHNHADLRGRIAAFQSALFESPLSSQQQAHAQATISAPVPALAAETATDTLNLNTLAKHVDPNSTATMSMAAWQTPGPSATSSTSSGVNRHRSTIEPRNDQEKDRGTNKGKGNRNKQKGDQGRAPVVVSPSVEGLDSSIVIDPRRMHMTLGVMALSLDPLGNEDGGGGGGDNGNGNGNGNGNRNGREKWNGNGNGKESVPTGGRGGRGEQGGNVSNVRPASNTNPTSTPTPTPTPAVVHGCRTDNEDPTSKPVPALNEKTHHPNPNPDSNSVAESANPPHTKTVASALGLLSSLKPRISAILAGDKGVVVPLEVMDVLKTTRMPEPLPNITPHRAGAGFLGSVSEGRRSGVMSAGAGAGGGGVDVKGGGGRVEAKQRQEKEKEREKERVGTSVLYIGPRDMKAQVMAGAGAGAKSISAEGENDEYGERQNSVIHRVMHPAKLHCTILNASHQKPSRRIPFCYTDILESRDAMSMLGASDADVHELQTEVINTSASLGEMSAAVLVQDGVWARNSQDPGNPGGKLDNPQKTLLTPKYRRPVQVPPPIGINLGAYRVEEIQLWEMGSRGPDGGYVSCGGVVLE
ncbi:hypothetical protein CVT25_015079 [Psilocybe cyanescens]|uniref:Uncharacterized protein n=1 Tax=Psilocybe cyanescens TaxID=93625 RepID=A0A409WRZ9_PSICY|nr:hypothetical protein CVT25_015079 [Psilocybe cyanescens]